MCGRFVYRLRNKKDIAVIIAGQKIRFVPVTDNKDIFFSLQSVEIVVDNDKVWYRTGGDVRTYHFCDIDETVYDSLLCGVRTYGGSFSCVTKKIMKDVFFYSHGI